VIFLLFEGAEVTKLSAWRGLVAPPILRTLSHREPRRQPHGFRRLATRYDKLHAYFAAMLSLACIVVWLKP
jgi:transposase